MRRGPRPIPFWTRVEIDANGCWVWQGATNRGHGVVTQGRMLKAHRVAYEHCIGPIPAGLQLDHLCRNRPCVNPFHLEPVTHAENVRRGLKFRERKTHCKRGHEYTMSNTYKRADGRSDECRTCIRLRNNPGYLDALAAEVAK